MVCNPKIETHCFPKLCVLEAGSIFGNLSRNILKTGLSNSLDNRHYPLHLGRFITTTWQRHRDIRGNKLLPGLFFHRYFNCTWQFSMLEINKSRKRWGDEDDGAHQWACKCWEDFFSDTWPSWFSTNIKNMCTSLGYSQVAGWKSVYSTCWKNGWIQRQQQDTK